MTRSTTAVADHHRGVHEFQTPTDEAARSGPTVISRGGPVVAMRQRPVIAHGGLLERDLLDSHLLVSAHDLDNSPWWLPAAAVWADASTSERPTAPHPTGLATADTEERALLAGLSDRLGWEAMTRLDDRQELSLLNTSTLGTPVNHDEVAIIDGQLGLDIPTVIIVGHEVLRWGAGASWNAAIQRALYPDARTMEPAVELAQVATRLRQHGLTIATVDLSSSILRSGGVHRLSVQLLSN